MTGIEDLAPYRIPSELANQAVYNGWVLFMVGFVITLLILFLVQKGRILRRQNQELEKNFVTAIEQGNRGEITQALMRRTSLSLEELRARVGDKEVRDFLSHLYQDDSEINWDRLRPKLIELYRART